MFSTKSGMPVEADQRQDQARGGAVAGEEIAQRIGERRREIDAGPRAAAGKRQCGKHDHAEACDHRRQMDPDSRVRRPGRENGVADAGRAQSVEHAGEHAGIGGQARAQNERAGRENDQPGDPFERLAYGGGPNAFGMDRADGVVLLARRRQHCEDADRHQRRHHGIGEIPAVGVWRAAAARRPRR